MFRLLHGSHWKLAWTLQYFSDRLAAGDVDDLDDYIMYLSNIDMVLYVHVAPHIQLLRTLEANYC